MAHLYKATEWQNGSCWYVNDVEELASVSSKWWTPLRLLDITVEEFFFLLKDTFNATNFHYNANTNVLMFSFDTQAAARKYKNYINAQARKRNYICGK